MIFADTATPPAAFMGNWFFAVCAFVALVGAVGAILTYFATRREVDKLADDIKATKEDNAKIWQAIDDNWKKSEAANEVRAHDIHARLNPAAENISEVKGQMHAFTQSFESFTKIIVAIAQNKKP